MNFRLIAVGKASHQYAQLGIQEYLKRLKKYGNFQLVYVKEGNPEVVSERLLKAAKDTCVVALDETGKSYSSQKFADQIRLWTDEPQIKTISFIIGASDGHTDEIRNSAQKQGAGGDRASNPWIFGVCRA